MNYFDDIQEEEFSDRPEEIEGKYDSNGQWQGDSAPPAEVKTLKPAAPVAAPVQQEEVVEEETQEPENEDGEDFTTVLSDARLRLEQGKLYEMIMNHDLFQGVEVDPKAVKFVQKQIRNFAKEQMEIMLGMRQAASEQPAAFPMEAFPFNALEVDILKMLASTATKGATAEAEPYTGPQAPAPRQAINPIGKGQTTKPAPKKPLATKPAAPVKRATPRTNAEIQRILDEEGVTLDEINQVFDPNRQFLQKSDLKNLSAKEMEEKNRQIRNKRAVSTQAMPMPSQEQIDQFYTQKAQQADANPQMQMILAALDRSRKK